MIAPTHVQSLLKFQEIQRRHWQPAVERTVLAFVRAFTRSAFGGLSEDDHIDDDSVDVVGGVRAKRSPYDSDSDSSDAVGVPLDR